jgi:hypothetical protein
LLYWSTTRGSNPVIDLGHCRQVSNHEPGSAIQTARTLSVKPDFGSTTSVLPRDEMGVKHSERTFCAINNGVDSMSFIMRFIYREYCRACLMHYRHF